MGYEFSISRDDSHTQKILRTREGKYPLLNKIDLMIAFCVSMIAFEDTLLVTGGGEIQHLFIIIIKSCIFICLLSPSKDQ